MSGSHSLTLFRPGAPAGSPPPAPPPGVPATFREAGLLINHGLLAAELLGLDTREAQATVDVAGGFPEPVLQAYDDEDAAVLAALLTATAEALAEATDEAGAPRGPFGERLAASPLLARDEQGRLYFESHRLLVAELRRGLPVLTRLLDHAAANGLWLLME